MTDEREFEYMVPDSAPQFVYARQKHGGPGQPSQWRVYQHCDSPERAQYILALLESDQRVEDVVRE